MEKPKQRRKKNGFQNELSEALRVRREKGLSAGFSSPEEEDEEESDDDYEDDFEEEVVTPVSNKTISYNKTSVKKREWESPYDDDDDDDDIIGGGGSMFLKGNSTVQKKPLFDPLGMSKGKEKTQEKSKSIARQSALLDDGGGSSEEEDSLLQLLKSHSKSKNPIPTKRTKGSDDRNPLRKSPTSFIKTQSIQSPERSRSPPQEMFRPQPLIMKKTSRPNTPSKDVDVMFQDTKSTSPREKLKSPTGQRTFEQGQLVASPDDLRRLLEQKERLSSPLKERASSPVQRSKSPVGAQQTSALKSILSTMNDQDQPHSSGHEKSRDKLKATDAVKSQSIVDFLLDDSHPKPVPRKRGSRSSQESYSQQDGVRRPTSPISVKPNQKNRGRSRSDENQLRKSPLQDRSRHRSLSDEGNRKKSTSQRAASPITTVQFNIDENTKPLSPYSNLQSDRGLLRERGDMLTMGQGEFNQTQMMQTTSPKHVLNRTESKQAKMDANDLLALFNQAVKSEEPIDIQAQVQQKQEKAKSPIEEVVKKTAEQNRLGVTKQRSSQQLIENVIDNVAKHNEKPSLESEEESSKKSTKTPRLKTGKKSYRTPPVNYQGLGSLSGLKDLKKQDIPSPRSEDFQPESADDIRKAIYMEWLAKREEESKKKKLEEAKVKKAEQEKQEKEKRDKVQEAIATRRAWEERKNEENKQSLRVKRVQDRQKRKEDEEKEQQKLKSQKQAERHRQELLESAKIRHQAEQRKKHAEERKHKENERKTKELNRTAVSSWMNKRGDSWVKEQKKKEKEKKQNQKKEEYIKEEASKNGEEKYKKWRETKDEQLKVALREKRLKERRQKYGYDDDEENFQPPWSPPNKVIPRRR